MRKIQIQIIIALIGYLSSQNCFAKLNPYVFVVKDIQGEVRQRPRFAIAWKPLKDREVLRPGTIIEVMADARLTLSFQNPNRGELRGAETTITFETPIMVRLDDELIKEADIKLYHYDDAALVKNDNFQVFDQDLFQRVWQWIIVELPRSIEFLEDTKYTQQRNQLKNNISVRHREIKIFYPEDGMEIFTYTFPHRIKVSWTSTKIKSEKYQFFIWEAGDVTPTRPQFLTKFNEAYINIPQAGSYYFMIKTLNEHYRSKAHLIHVIPYSDLSFYQLSGKIDQKEANTEIIKGPLSDQHLITADKKAKISFFLDETTLSPKPESWWIEVKNSSGKTSKFCLKNKSFCEIQLPRGVYYWRAATILEKERQYQKWRIFKASHISDLSDAFKEGLNHDLEQNLSITQ